MSKQVCEAINEIDKNVVFDSKSQEYTFKDQIYGVYCSPSRKGEKGQCDSSGKLLGSAFISLLNFFENVNDYEDNLKNEKLAEYAILWLNYKNDQNPKRLIGVYDIYDMLTRNKWFGKHYHSLKDKTGIMKIYFSYLNRLYALLKGICNTITKCNEDPSNASECLKQAQNCVKIYQYLSNNCPWYKDCTLYCNILSHLKNDYDKFREKYKTNNLPELKLPDGGQSCESLCKSKEQKFNAKKAKSENSKMDTSPTNSLSGQSSNTLTGNQGYSMSGIEGKRNESDSITDKSVNPTKKLKDSVDGAPYILGIHRKLRDNLPGIEGGSNEKYDVLIDKSSLFETVGGVGPQINGLGGHMGELPGDEDESSNTNHDFPHIKIESQNISTTIEDNLNQPKKIQTLFFDNPLGYPSLYPISHSGLESNSVSSSDSNSGSNLGNNIIYIVVPFVVILVILGISYKWVEIRRKNMLKKAQSIKRVINLCDEKNNENEVINTFIKNKKRPNYKLGL
ncbi:Plasmodium variant antigen protein Cir/Yir/Bir, putative [Plasmodium chabaudi adami]|uniref:Plasmodium variant antigen protein Cir/Yir/Bir, putative n=1 Tax=Plasmodium chabaudi adami TaxID=5826 RepID=A0A1C6WSQ4_PLACE|nr:Plasmodium variant antigen protein Cir/Yir/Bir, putative [Plasmodium chabaudi adami]